MQNQNTTLKTRIETRGRKRIDNPNAPVCLTCRGVMSPSGRGSSRWSCRHQCKYSIYKQTSGTMRGSVDSLIDHPRCVKCRRAMVRHGADYKQVVIWRCTYCKVFANAVRVQVQTRGESKRARVATRKPTPKADHPHCVNCRWQMKQCGTAKRRLIWACSLCGASCARFGAQRERKPIQTSDNGDDLITFIDSKLTNYSVEMREELRGEIAIALLTHAKIGGLRLTRESLTPATIRLIAKPIYKMQPNRFRDVSLEHCYDGDGVRLEERLAG